MTKREKLIIDTYLNNTKLSLNDIKKMFGITRYSLDKLFFKENITKRKNQSELIQKSRKWFFDEEFFFRETPETAYFMGFCMADGCLFKAVKSKYYSWYIGIHKKDTSILVKFCNWLNLTQSNIRAHDYRNEIKLTGKFFNQDFSKWGMVPRKTYNPVIPNVPSNIIRYFLIGLIDGDGSIKFSKKTGYKFNLVNNKLITEWFATTIRLLGYDGKLTYDTLPEKVWNRVRISNKNDVLKLSKILEIDKCDFCLDRKWANIKNELSNSTHNGHFHTPILHPQK